MKINILRYTTQGECYGLQSVVIGAYAKIDTAREKLKELFYEKYGKSIPVIEMESIDFPSEYGNEYAQIEWGTNNLIRWEIDKKEIKEG